MKLAKIIFISFFFCFSSNIFAQFVNMNDGMRMANAKSKNIVSGKVEFVIQEKRKGSKEFTSTHCSMTFYNQKEKKNWMTTISNYANVFFPDDSIQYIYKPKSLITINHKKKTVYVDTSNNINPILFMLPSFVAFYNNIMHRKWDIDKVKALKTTTTSTTVTFTLNSKKIKPEISENYQEEKNIKKEKDNTFAVMMEYLTADYRDIYECRKSDSLLLRYTSKLSDTKPYSNNAVIETKVSLTNAEINDTTYESSHFYNYLNYIDNNYKVDFALSKEELEQQLNSTKNTTAPDFTLPIVGKNDSITLSNYKGKWVLLDFWFMACGPCKKLMPEIEEIQKQYQPKGLSVFGVNTDKNDTKLHNFIKTKEPSYQMLSCYDTEITSSYKVAFYPTVIIINPEQTIVFIGTGSNIGNELRNFLENNIK